MRGIYVLCLTAFWLGGLTGSQAWDASSEPLALRYLAILERNPANETAAERLWEIYSTRGDTETFLKKLRSLAAKDPIAGVSLANFLQRSGQVDEAAQALRNLSPSGLDSKSLIRIGKLWELLGKPGEAVAAWEMAIAADPQNLALRSQIAQACLDAGNPAAAITHWDVLAREATASERLLALENLRAAHEATGDYHRAALHAKEALNSLAPGHWKVPDLIGRTITLHEEAGELDALESEWANSQQPGLAVRMAVLAKKRGDPKARVQWLNEASEADPKNVALLGELAMAELAVGNAEAAEKLLRRRFAMAPNDAQILADLASFLANQGQEAGALGLIETHFASLSSGETANANKVALLRKLNLREGLGQALRESFEQSKTSWPAARELAEYLLETGSSQEASRVFQTLDGATPADKQRDLRIQVARFFYDMQVPGESEIRARKALESDPNDPEVILLLAEILEARGDLLAALALVEAAAPATADTVNLELDQQLFSLFQRRDSESDPALRNVGTKAFLQRLLEPEGSEKSADRFLRASRWAAWSGDPATAVTTLRAALALRADSPEVLDQLADELEKLGEFDEAALVLSRLEGLQPDPATKIRIARMDVARGEAEAATAMLAQAVKANPHDANLTRELAMAQEAAGQNFEALESWLRAFELSPPSEKQNLGKSVLKSFSRLSLVDRGLEFLAITAPRLPDDRLRLEFLRDGTAFARENDVLDRWQEILQSPPPGSSVAWKMALSELLPETTDHSPPVVSDTKDAMELLLQDAEAKRDFGRAALLAGKLADLPKATPGDHIRSLHFFEMTQPAEKAH
ncbi:MAG: hypothetical protein WEB60_11215, partial [Terrimicrobiaceae bacterium]